MALPSNYKQIAVGAPTGLTPSSNRSRAGGGGDRNKDNTPVFTHSNYGNPAFTPQKVGKSSSSSSTKSQTEARAPKPPKAPEKPVLPYMRYSKRIWDSVKAQFPDLKLWELGKKIGAMWKQLGEAEKQEFVDEYEADKVEYEKALKAYHNSPAYLAFMAAKSKVKSDTDVHETPSRASGKSQQERRIDIQPAEDEEDQDEGYSFKHLAYARYLRNHRLINEIFSDAVVPDVRSVVTTQRMQVLKRQVSSLTMHQTKLEAELQQMEEKFEAKKQRMMESSEAFQEELQRHCKPAVDDETFQKMVVRMYEEIKRDRQRMEDPNHGAAIGGVSSATATASVQGATAAAAVVGGVSGNNRVSGEDKLLPNMVQTASAIGYGMPGATVGPVMKKDNMPLQQQLPLPTVTAAAIPSTVAKTMLPHEANASKTEPEPMDIEPPQPSQTKPLMQAQKCETRNVAANEPPKAMKPIITAVEVSVAGSGVSGSGGKDIKPLAATAATKPMPQLTKAPTSAAAANIPTPLTPVQQHHQPQPPLAQSIQQQQQQLQQPPQNQATNEHQPPQQQQPILMPPSSTTAPSVVTIPSSTAAQPPQTSQPQPPSGVQIVNPTMNPQPTPTPPPPQLHPQPPPPQQQPVPPTMQMHPSHHGAHLPPHMQPHQTMSGMPPPPHAGYGGYGPTGPTRSSYYQPQYGPTQPYGQYAPYPHYQQPYGPPGSHYMRSPQHNGGAPMHYGEHAPPPPQVPGQPPQQQVPPPPGHLQPHDVYGQQQQQAVPPPVVQQPPPPSVAQQPPTVVPTQTAPQVAPPPPAAAISGGPSSMSDKSTVDSEKKDGE